MFDLSIVLPTCNRASLLQRAIEAIRSRTRCDYELIVVDGASTDQTPQVLADARIHLGDRLRVIREEMREGFVKAANKGFRAACGRNMIWINDDARPLEGALDLAVAQIDAEFADVGFVALFHRWRSTRNVAYETLHEGKLYRLCHLRGTLYANFPVGRRETYERLGYFDEQFYLYGADPDLSLKAWHAGLRIVPAYGSMIDHDEHEDDRRVQDGTLGLEDNQRLFDKWDLPPKNLYFNDFDPSHPCTLRGPRQRAARRAA